MWPFIIIAIVVAYILFLLYWPTDVQPVAWTPPPAPPLEGEFAVNNALSGLTLLPVEGKGPEDVIMDSQGRLVTGREDGTIVRMQSDGSQLEELVNTGGRPLGLAEDKSGRIIIADAYKGLLALSADGQLECLVDKHEGRQLLFTNHLDIATDGTIYFSESSDRFGFDVYKYDLLENRGNGRLFRFDPQNGKLTVLLDGLHFANGVALSADESFVLVCETGRYRVQKLWLSGPRAGEHEPLFDNLPGFPDNLHRCSDGLFWLALASPRKPELDAILPWPAIRRLVRRLPEALQPSATHYGFVLAFNEAGEIVHNLQDPSGSFGETTGAFEQDGWLYVSSLYESELGKVKLPAL